MVTVTDVANALDRLFRVEDIEQDPAMSRFVPAVYGASGINWQSYVTPEFASRFNGLMVRGDERVGQVYSAAFPSMEVLDAWLAQARHGDLLITHHPIDCRNGAPWGVWGKGFVPISQERLDAITERRLNMYACHAPLDTANDVGTTAAMVEALGGRTEGNFFEYGAGHAGRICRVSPLSTAELRERLLRIYNLTLLEQEGPSRDRIEVVAVVAGVGDKITHMEEAERLGAQAYVTGELHVRIEGEYGRARYAEVEAFAQRTNMSLLGVSHAASEHLVMETQLPRWFSETFGLSVHPIREPQWWR
ncbi:MAG TPA: Nif3-like dinuclear metal center hexameric protein [Ktedonobacterales bacterium]|nr:Nif3-like dinuclear metal center hexameric protein [Ktedonobacterales bacterium]